ncbi:leucine-rich repeat neuronal protein 4 [Lathamus discolor]|uniref:leucine-rich repeat neuronal protein 4 n=1 Tax=Lathamus discolor TaxID=678569 RepID=UPI0032B767CB
MRGSEPGTNLGCACGQSREQGKLGTDQRHFTLPAESPPCIKSRQGSQSHAERRHEAPGLWDRSCKPHRRRMFSRLLILSLLVGNTVSSPVSRAEPAASKDVTPFFQLAHEDHWENVNLTSMPCEDRKNRTWITLQLTYSSLTAFPVCLPETLETLDLSNNLLEEMNGTQIANLPRLRVLSLRQNQLWSVRWGSEVLSSLLSLDLSFNKLSSVPSCHSSALPNLRWLSLSGNPLIEIQPLAFSCYPQLQFLNLSATLLGRDDSRGIRESAFAISTSPSEATNRPGNINVLDLSRTFLEKIQPEWTRDLPNLRSLHLTKMSRLRSLDTDFFKSMPALQELNCQDSHLLAFVQTEMFDSAPHLSQLSFENCNLSSFNPWNTNSSDNIIINLYGNPLICDCQLSWLLSKPKKVVLQKAWETFCYISQEDWGRPSTSLSLLELYNKCQSERNVTLPDSNTPSLEHDAFSLASYDATTVVTTTDSAQLTQDAYISSLIQMNVMSTTAANPTELMLTKANSSSHKEEAVSESTSTHEKEAVTESMSTHKEAVSQSTSTHEEEAVSESMSTHKEKAVSESMSTHREEAVSQSMSTHKEEAVSESMSTHKEEAVSQSMSTHKEEAVSESMSTHKEEQSISTHKEEAVSESINNSPSLVSVTTSPGFLKLFYDQSSDHGSTIQTEIDQLKTELRTTTSAFPQEGTSNRPTTDYSTTAMGSPSATDLQSFALYVQEGSQTSLPQLNSTRTTARSQPASTRSLIHYVDDYDYDEQSTQTPVQVPYTSCDYNPCRHLQKPCSELQRESRCLCPGMSREDEVPDAPRLREVSEVTDSSAQIRWCAPNSVVHTYELMFHAQGNEDRQLVLDNIYSTARQHTLYNLLPYTTYHICVTASNKAGSSQTSVQGIPGNSCTRFKTKPSYKSVFAALSAASGLFLISTIILSVCLCKACKKPQSEQYGTHLVSYKNPAFDYPLKLQTSN